MTQEKNKDKYLKRNKVAQKKVFIHTHTHKMVGSGRNVATCYQLVKLGKYTKVVGSYSSKFKIIFKKKSDSRDTIKCST